VGSPEEYGLLERPGRRGKNNIKIDSEELKCVAGFPVPQDREREDGNQSTGSIRGGLFFDQVSDCQILTKVSVPGAHLRLFSNTNRKNLNLCSLDILHTLTSYSDSGIVMVFLRLSKQFRGNTSRWA
jgi:hypothetical protein